MKLIQAGYTSENKLNAFILKAFVARLPHRFGDGLNSRLIDDRISNGVFDIKYLENGDPIEKKPKINLTWTSYVGLADSAHSVNSVVREM